MSERKSCPNLEINLKDCRCTYLSCERRGRCCECIRYHKRRNELPGCLFPPEIEETYDRSIQRFVSVHSC
ncbi:hypothetical protein GWO13_00340 [Candidatus Bathyarchaeota archaeon]|nr:hypothetical protein [Candidatus Bathyarchaeota archaeon]